MTTTTDVAPHGSALSLTTDQDTFTPRQRAMLAHMGVENAPEEDLAVFLHIAQRTGPHHALRTAKVLFGGLKQDPHATVERRFTLFQF